MRYLHHGGGILSVAILFVDPANTNLAFAEWVTVFAGDEKLTTALLDRLAHHATVITTKGKSYRMRKRRDPEATMPTPPTPKPPARVASRS